MVDLSARATRITITLMKSENDDDFHDLRAADDDVAEDPPSS